MLSRSSIVVRHAYRPVQSLADARTSVATSKKIGGLNSNTRKCNFSNEKEPDLKQDDGEKANINKARTFKYQFKTQSNNQESPIPPNLQRDPIMTDKEKEILQLVLAWKRPPQSLFTKLTGGIRSTISFAIWSAINPEVQLDDFMSGANQAFDQVCNDVIPFVKQYNELSNVGTESNNSSDDTAFEKLEEQLTKSFGSVMTDRLIKIMALCISEEKRLRTEYSVQEIKVIRSRPVNMYILKTTQTGFEVCVEVLYQAKVIRNDKPKGVVENIWTWKGHFDYKKPASPKWFLVDTMFPIVISDEIVKSPKSNVAATPTEQQQEATRSSSTKEESTDNKQEAETIQNNQQQEEKKESNKPEEKQQ